MMFPDCTLCNDTGLTPVDGGMVYPCSCLEKLPPVTFTDEDLDEVFKEIEFELLENWDPVILDCPKCFRQYVGGMGCFCG